MADRPSRNHIPRSDVIEIVRRFGFDPNDTVRIEMNTRFVDHYRADGSRIRYWLSGQWDRPDAETFTGGDDQPG